MRSPARQSSAHRLAAGALLLACAALLGYLESVLLPPLPVPGLRLGLANIAIVLALAMHGPRVAAVVSLGRVLVVALATGTLGGPAFLLSLAGAYAALAAMVLLACAGPTFSVVGWSVLGSAAHVTGQLLVASLLVSSSAPLALLPVSLGLSVPLGLAVGSTVRLLLSRIPDLSLSAAGR
ncbi:MAG: Gx transporter family protein [Anaerosomatales bacterium]|nr:Gx transporter family protein [Anaerosomatales bacterium]MDT8433559.1 Gx transporter family protein [Anaerosomatales bacterium]